MTRKALARKIAIDLFDCPGSSNGDAVQRIQFRGGDWARNKETDLGGLCLSALIGVIHRSLLKHLKGKNL